ncbi:hypothetical protein MKW98_010774 [Papaver atlanticum]|uniref:Uncharacterized protein n=1 Tax=Papaver atlanticum TaxID=357466 RepID=A0AAD4SNY2_9MAGN|nr:hypothetical protein MKW98_010774 [Papaver atlanticum]
MVLSVVASLAHLGRNSTPSRWCEKDFCLLLWLISTQRIFVHNDSIANHIRDVRMLGWYPSWGDVVKYILGKEWKFR